MSRSLARFLMLALAAAAVFLAAGADPARAQGKLDARYTATLAGIPIGRGAWVIDIADDQYTAAASGVTSGLMRIFASGQGTGASRGSISGGQPVAASYASTITYDQKTDEVQMKLVGGNVKEYSAEPPARPHPDRIPVTDAHRRGVTDPMTASLTRVPGNGDPVAPEACARNIPIFDGRLRYDLRAEYKRMDQVKAEKGYQGPAVVCALYFVPMSGFVPGRPAVKHLAGMREAEVWLVPIAGTRVVVPFRISIPTPVGLGVLQATQFVSTPQPARASMRGAKTQ